MGGAGAELLDVFAELHDGRSRQTLMRYVERNIEWIEDRKGRSNRRSVSKLARNRKERDAFNKLAEVDPVAVDFCLLRAQRIVFDEPLTLRIGITEVPKQAGGTDDVWHATDLPRQRGAERIRDGRLMLITSKSVGSTVLPGPTAAVRRLAHPDDAVRSVISTIARADPEARIVDVELDYFDRCISDKRKEKRPPFCFCLPSILSGHATKGPIAMRLDTVPEISDIPVSGEAMEVRNLRTGKVGGWSQPYEVDLEVLGEAGTIEVRRAEASVCTNVAFRPPGWSSRGSIVRIRHARSDGVRLSSESHLVLVLGEHPLDALVDIAAQTLSISDEHPHVADYIEARAAARIFRGEQKSRSALHVDRALAGVALSAVLLDGDPKSLAPA